MDVKKDYLRKKALKYSKSVKHLIVADAVRRIKFLEIT